MKPLFTESQIKQAVVEIANELNTVSHTFTNPLIICVLKGGVMFFSDLIRELTFDFEIEFGSLDHPFSAQQIQARSIIIVDEFYDSGKTAQLFIRSFNIFGARDIHFVTLLKRQSTEEPLDFLKEHQASLLYGLDVENEDWLFGYGLDLDQKKRNLKDIYVKRDI